MELEVLGGPGAVPSAGHEPYRVAVSAGNLDAEEDFSDCAFFLHAFSPGIAEVIFRIADAGGMAIIPAARIAPLLPPSADPADLPADLELHHRVASGGELFSALGGEYGRYARWRDRVLPGAGRRQPLFQRLGRAIRGLGRR